jgi:hypothetical protein
LTQTGHLPREFAWQEEIIAVEVLNKFASRYETPCLSRSARPSVLTMDRANFEMTFSQRFCFPSRFVG